MEGRKEKGTAGTMIEKPLSIMVAVGEKPSVKMVQISCEHTQSAASFEFSCSRMAPFCRQETSSIMTGSSAGGLRPTVISLASLQIEVMLMFVVGALSMSMSTCLD